MRKFKSKDKKTYLKTELSHGFSTNTKVNVQKCLKFPCDHNVKSVGKKSTFKNSIPILKLYMHDHTFYLLKERRLEIITHLKISHRKVKI